MNTFLAVVCVSLFSLTVPFTRLVALELGPEILTLLRLIGAGFVCALLVLQDWWLPPKSTWPQLFIISLSSVIGFSVLMAFSMREVPGSHGAVALAILPAVTAAYASLRDRVNPGFAFWCFAAVGTLLSLMFFFTQSSGELMVGDALLGLAIVVAALGYVEGARLSRQYSGRRVMSWAIIITLPVSIALVVFVFPVSKEMFDALSLKAWFAIFYLALISQSLGMILWYRVLAQGQMEKIALVQLLQPFLTLLASIVVLQEVVPSAAWLIALLVVLCIFGANTQSRNRKLIRATNPGYLKCE